MNAETGTAVGSWGTILRTTDGGGTWVRQTNGAGVTLHGVAFMNADLGTVVGDAGTILRTTTGGEDTPVGFGYGLFNERLPKDTR